jgi:hypothetical protein|tara:strand:- start:597 stop:806 length:210 start_codon:yes stop_codon:yes gene_type:complete
MSKATVKDRAIDAALKDVFGIDRVQSVSDDVCVSCKKEAREFNDALSRQEYLISGLCQKCQDGVFNIDS